MSMRQTRLSRDQRGITSIMITMLMMFITSLIVLAFAQVARREQRTALDNQLSTQAYYAAESGVNSAQDLIKQALLIPDGNLPSFLHCGDSDSSIAPVLDNVHNVEITCLTINSAPSQLTGVVNTQGSSVFHIKADSPFTTGLKITWNKPDSSTLDPNNCPSATNENESNTTYNFTDGGSWQCPMGVLRYDLTQIPTIFNAQTLANTTQTAFVIPKKASAGTAAPVPFTVGPGVPISYSVHNGRSNKFLATTCTGSSCSVVIQGLTGSEYYLNLRMMYGGDSNVTIERADSTDHTPFKDSQAQIDATGKAQDVLRRIRVAVNLQSGSDGASAAISAGDGPCKQQFLSRNEDGTYSYSDQSPGGCGE